jgi:hypothetical protein
VCDSTLKGMQNHLPANDDVFFRERCRSLPIAESVTFVPGFPAKLKIFQTNASPYWQVRCFFAPRVIIRSLRTTNKRDAIQYAKMFYDQELAKRGVLGELIDSGTHTCHTINQTVNQLVQNEGARSARGEISRQSYLMIRSRSQGEILKFFKDQPADRVDRVSIERFVSYLSQKNIRGSTIKGYLTVLKKVLTTALHHEWIDRLPVFPQIKVQANPRGHFTVSEYRRLLRSAKRLRREYVEPESHSKTHRSTRGGIYTATAGVPWEFAWLIGFMVNSFVRPVDVKVIQHKHVEIIRTDHCYLRLKLPETKRHSAQIITMPAAVHIYERLREYQAAPRPSWSR